MKRLKIILRLIWNREWHKIKWWESQPSISNYKIGVDHAQGNSKADNDVVVVYDRWTKRIALFSNKDGAWEFHGNSMKNLTKDGDENTLV